MSKKRYILKNTNAISTNYPTSERVYDTVLKRELYDSEIVDLLNELSEEMDYWKRRCKEWNLKGKDKHLAWKRVGL